MVLRLPHTYVLLFALVVAAAALTWLVPAGEYLRREERGRRLVDPQSFHLVDRHPAGVREVLLAWPRGLEATAPIVFYLFIIGGAFGAVQATGALDAGIAALVRRAGGRGEAVIPLLVVVFALGGGTIGVAEEALAVLPALVVLVRRLGYDDVVAGLIGLAGAAAGFSGAFLNPFTVGVGQAITGLPLFSGMSYRLVVWTVVTLVTTIWIARTARKLRVGRTESEAAAGEDGEGAGVAARAEVATGAPATAAATAAAPAAASARHAASAAPAEAAVVATAPEPTAVAAADPGSLTGRRRAVLLTLLAAVMLLVAGALWWSWGLVELSGLFVATAVVAGLAGGLGADGTAESFVRGAAGFTGAALVVGLARGVLVVFDGARITDTILHSMAGAVRELPDALTVAGIYVVQVLLSYVVPSGSGQAALSLPILAPLGDLVGVTRQTSVLAYQFGDGFSNVFTPTQGYFMAGLAMIGVPWTRWVRVLWPLQLIWLGLGLAFLLVAHAIRWGPF